jgi:ribosomal protein L37AE/L43A
MTGPAEASVIWRGWLLIKRGLTYVFVLGKRIATLEARVTALEEALGKQSADACPYCGERAMRKTKDGMLFGPPGKQSKQDVWTCKSCNGVEKRTVRV